MKKNKYAVGNFELRVGKSNTGKGLFAVDTIPKNSCVIEYTGKILSEKEQYTCRSRYLFCINKNTMVNGNIPSNTARYINHSCGPNCEIYISKGKIFVFSKKGIKAGEELNYNYGKEYFDKYLKPNGCRCSKCK